MTRRLNLFLLIVLLLVGLPAYWFLIDNPVESAPAKPLSINELRHLAKAMPGQAPSALEVEVLASRRLPQTLLAAGSGFRSVKVTAMSFRLPVNNGRPIIIDTGFSQAAARIAGYRRYNLPAQAAISGAIRSAALVLVTHEHADQMGLLTDLAASEPAILHRARLNQAQIKATGLANAVAWPPGAALQASLPDDRPVAVAPGVVIIPAPDSHTPGSQMIFVHLADGREFLFTGDIAPLTINWVQLRLPSRWNSDHLNPSNRRELHAWLQAIRNLHRQAPSLVIVPGQDLSPLARLKAATEATMHFGDDPEDKDDTGQ